MSPSVSKSFRLPSFSFDISDIVDKSGTAHVIGNSCFKFAVKLDTLAFDVICSGRMLVLLVSSSLNKYHFELGKGVSIERSSVNRLQLEARGLW